MRWNEHPRRKTLRRPKAVRTAAVSWAETLEGRVLLSTAAPAVPYVSPGQAIAATGSLLSAPTTGQPLDVALAYLRSHASALGLTAADLSSPAVTDQYTDPDTGETHIYLEQRVNGITISGGDLSISLTRNNQIISAGGHFVSNAAASLLGHTSSTHLSLTAAQALAAAAPGLGLDLNAVPTVQSSGAVTHALAGPFLSTTLVDADASLDPIPAKLVYVPTPSGLRLAWDMVLRTPDGAHWYDTRIDGATGSLLGTSDWMDHLASPNLSSGASSPATLPAADTSAEASPDVTSTSETYDVYPLPDQSPDDGPRTMLTNPADPTFSPYGWHDTNGKAGAESTLTAGNNVNAYIDAADTNVVGFQPDGGASLTFDAPLDLSQDPTTYRAAAVEQLFYLTNALHDIHASYGFTEASGNFQTLNYSGQGRGGDALQAQAQDGGALDNSNFSTPPDGQSPVMQIYLFDKTQPRRDADLDSTIVVHEYGHGVSTRLTGGPSNSDALDALQSAGMGEGWSDWWALMLTQKPTDTQNGAYGVANYATGTGDGTGGIRQYPYSYNLAADPLTFNDFGPNGAIEVHASGTIWASALWDLNWQLIDKYGFSPTIAHGYNANVPGENGGNNLSLKLIMDALKLQPPNPSFIDARNAILAADQALNGGKDLLQIWTAFARRGLGYSATDASPGAAAVNSAFDLPPQFANPRIVAQSPGGTLTAPPQSIDLTFNTAMDSGSFSVASDIVSFTGPGGTNVASQISGFSWSADDTTLHITFAPVSASGQYTLTVGPQILSADTQAAMDQNLNGISGEAADSYTAHFGYAATPLAVSSISPAGGSIVALPLTTLDVHFNQPIDASSVNPFLLEPSRGFVTGATVLDSSTVRYTLAGLNAEGPVTLTLPAGAVKDANGNDSAAFSASYSVDIASTPFPSPLFPQLSGAPLVWDRTTNGTIGYAGDVDSFTLDLDAGQVLTAVVSGAGGGLRPTVDLLDSQGQVIVSGAAEAAGGDATAEDAAVPVAGTYTIRVSGAAGTTGAYSVHAILNAAVQNLDASFISLGNGAAHGAVLGQLPAATSAFASDDFSSGTLGPAWTTFSSDPINGEIYLNQTDGHTYLLMDHNDSDGSTNNLNEAVWAVNLSGQTTATLTFEQTSFGDEQDFLPADYTGDANGDGVSISDDNVHWHRVWDGVTTSTQGVYGTVAVDLAAAAAAAGMKLGPNFRIKFQQFDNYPIPIDGRGFGDISVSVAPPTTNYYSVSLKAGETIGAQVAAQDIPGGERLDLLDANGNVLAAGVNAGTDTSDFTFNGVTIPADGTYYVRVSGESGGHYSLSVTTNAELETERNDSSAQPIVGSAIGGTRTILGRLNASTGSDRFSIFLNSGDVLTLRTATPGDGPDEPANLLDPVLRLLDSANSQVASDNNSAPDGRNAQLTYTAPASGIYVIDVSLASTSPPSGDYVLSVTGGSTPAASFTSQITDPRAGTTIGAPPPLIDVALSQPVLFSSVSPASLTIDGIAAHAVVLSDGQTLGFVFSSPLPDGPHTIAIAAGAFIDLQGDPVAATTLVFTTQSVSPRVVSSSVTEGDVLTPGDLTYTASFNQVMTTQGLDASKVRLLGLLSGQTFSPSTFGFDSSGKLFTATYTGLPQDNYVLTLSAGPGGFADAAGNPLDGEPSWPLPAAGSGDGIAGGDFFVDFSIDVATAPFPTPLAQQAPAGSLVYTGSLNGTINTPADSDSFTIALAAGQLASLQVVPASGNWTPRITLLGPGGTVLGDVTALQAGQNATLNTLAVAASGTYTLIVSGAGGAGAYSVELALNAAFKVQTQPDSLNNSPATAQNLDGDFTSLDPFRDAQRGAVLASIDAQTAASDYYSLTLNAGQWLSVGSTTDFFGGITVRLFNSFGEFLAIGAGHSLGSAASIADYVIPQTGTYYLAVDAAAGASYNLVVLKNADFESSSNQTQATPQDVSALGLVLGSVGDIFDAADYYSVAALPGNVLTFRTDTPGGPPGEFDDLLNPELELLGPDGSVVASDDRSAPDRRNAELHYTVPAGGAGLYTLQISANGGLGEYVLAVDGVAPASAPGAPSLLAASDSGVSSNDRVTNFNNAAPGAALQFTIPNTVAGATVELFANDILIGTAVADDSSLTMTTDGQTLLPDGLYSIVAREIIGEDGGTVSSPAMPLRILTAPPAAPGAPSLDPSTASGSSTTITNNATPLLHIPTPLFWRMFRDGVLVSNAISQGATFSSAPLAPGVYHFTVQAIDAAGNVSAAGSPLTLTIDQTAPVTTTVTAPPVTAPHGKSYGFLVTFTDNTAIDVATLGNSSIIVNGPAGYAPAATLISYSASGNTVTAFYRVPAPSAGWTGVYSGTYFINLVGGKVRDVAGNAAVADTLAQFAVALPITAPRAPQLTLDSDRGISNTDDLTNLNNATPPLALQFFVADTQPGGLVSIYADGVLIGSTVATDVTAIVPTAGNYALANGSHQITARITAPGQPQTADSAPLTITIFNQSLLTPSAPVLHSQDDSGISDSDGITNVTSPTFDVSAAPYFRLEANGTVVSDPFVLGTTYTIPAIADGSYDVRVIAEDDAGNESAPSAATHVVIDTQLPPLVTAGELDPSFGGGGLVTLPADGNDGISAIAAQPDGRIIAAGLAVNPATGATMIKVVRFNVDGSQDLTFGTKGVKYTLLSVNSLMNFRAMAIQSDGKIILAGDGGIQFAVTRLNADGSLDKQLLYTLAAGQNDLSSVFVQPDDSVVLAGQIAGQMGVFLLNSDLSSLGAVKYSVPGFSQATITSIARDSAGRLILAGTVGSGFSTSFVLARTLTNASLDTTFGSAGFVVSSFGTTANAARVRIGADGRIVVAGTVIGGQSSIGLERYNSNGSPDLTFGTQGLIVATLPSNVSVSDMLLQPDGRILVVGTTSDSSVSPSGFAARFTSNGMLDPLFGSNGSSFYAPRFGTQTFSQAMLLPSGSMLVGGSAVTANAADADFALAQIATVGPSITLDPASDSGINNTDGITNVTNPVFDVLGRGDNYYRVYLDGVLVSGLYETAPTYPIPLGQGNVTFTLVDAAGNESFMGVPTPYTTDTTPPGVDTVVANRSVTSATSTPYTAQVFYFDDDGLDLTTISNGAVLLTGPNGFSELGTLTSIQINTLHRATATYSFAPPGGAWDGTNNGLYTLSLQPGKVADIAGNLNAGGPIFVFQVSVTNPTLVAPALAPGFDSGSSNADGITNFNNSSPAKAPQFIVGGNVPGTLVTVYANGVPIGSAVASSYFVTVTGDGTTTLAEGAATLTARQTPPGGTQTGDSAPLAITIDTTPPKINLVNVNGNVLVASNAAFGINLFYSDPTGFNSSAVGVGNLVLTGPDGRTYAPVSINSTTINGQKSTFFQFTPPGGAFDGSNDGTYTYTMVGGQIIDNEGNAIPAGPIASFQVHIHASNPQSIALSPDTNSGIDPANTYTNFNNSSPAAAPRFVVTGTVAGALVQIYYNGQTLIGSAVAASFTTTVTGDGVTAIPNGLGSFTARQISADGTQSFDSVPLKINILREAVPAPSLSLNFADTGASNSDGVSTDKTFVFFSPGTYAWQAFVNGVAITPPNFTGAAQSVGSLADGTYVLTEVAIDAAGNRSAFSSSRTIVVDTQAPAAIANTPDFFGPPTAAYTFTVTFSDSFALDLRQLGPSWIQIVGTSDAFSAPTLVSSVISPDKSTVTAIFSIAAPAGGWPQTINGPYSVKPTSAVKDLAGNVISTLTIAHFNVNLAAAPSLIVSQPAQVVGRHVFYNNSAFDGKNPAANSGDDKAIAADKRALLPGQAASFANYTSYTNGINGIMIDIARLPRNATLTAADFVLRAGTSANPSSWKAAPAARSIAIRRGAGVGGSDRVELIFADRAIVNRWLQVTILATARTGLASADAFYFGNLIGETANSKTAATVTAADSNAAHAAATAHASIASLFDFNRDGIVNNADVLAARLNQNASLQLLTPPAAPTPALKTSLNPSFAQVKEQVIKFSL